MKKNTFLMVICLAFCSFTYAQYTAIPDPAFEQALIDDGIDSNSTPDGQILTSEAMAYSGDLDVANLGITNLTGIEAFTSITEINFNYNIDITSVDLSNCSSLIIASGLGCSALLSVNVTGLLNLTTLNLRSTALNSLNVSTNLALTTLNVRKCYLTSLDLSQNAALTFVDAKTNVLTFLDMRNGNNANITTFNSDFNSGLECVFVDDSSSPYLVPPVWIKGSYSSYVDSEAQCNTLSVDQLNKLSFSMYPNPAKNTLYITTQTNNSVINIFDITGKVILAKTLFNGENLVDVSNLSSGIYLVRFVSDNKSDTKKLIIN